MINKIVTSFLSRRLKQIDFFRLMPDIAQHRVFMNLMNNLGNSEYGKSVGIDTISLYSDFCEKVPVVTYEEYKPWIEKSYNSRSNVITDDTIHWYSKSSGTTSSQSKFIPVTKPFLNSNHLQGGRDTLAFLMDNYPSNQILKGKTLTLGGSIDNTTLGSNESLCGDISAIMMKNTPWYADSKRLPSKDIALLNDFEQKIDLICKNYSTEDIRAFAGVPSWNMVMLEKLMKYNNVNSIPEIWQNVELFIHGGVNFNPYREQYKKMFPNPNMKYIETYNASEGFIAIQDTIESGDMLLMCDYDIFYEFMPMTNFGDSNSVIPIDAVELGVNYALIISTSAGLWRYMIGDTVEFTSLNPHRIKITGRTKLYINTFGEELIVENCDNAVVEATKATHSMIKEYMVSPIYMEVGERGVHQWIIEFSKEAEDIELFKKIIDKTIQDLNSDYQAKRYNNSTLKFPEFIFVKENSFYKWYESRGKLGGQNKVPRLLNNRELSDNFINFVIENDLVINI